jgi:hypothetical protein
MLDEVVVLHELITRGARIVECLLELTFEAALTEVYAGLWEWVPS